MKFADRARRLLDHAGRGDPPHIGSRQLGMVDGPTERLQLRRRGRERLVPAGFAPADNGKVAARSAAYVGGFILCSLAQGAKGFRIDGPGAGAAHTGCQ